MISLGEVLQWKYGLVADTVDGKITVWRHPTIPQPDEIQLEADRREYIAFKAANLYQEKRASEYPPIAEGMDALVHKELGDPKPWKDYTDKCAAVKEKYPNLAEEKS